MNPLAPNFFLKFQIFFNTRVFGLFKTSTPLLAEVLCIDKVGSSISADTVESSHANDARLAFSLCCYIRRGAMSSTGHNEVVHVVYDPEIISFVDLLHQFWQSHDPTQGMGQGNDTGTQYRSGIYWYVSFPAPPSLF